MKLEYITLTVHSDTFADELNAYSKKGGWNLHSWCFSAGNTVTAVLIRYAEPTSVAAAAPKRGRPALKTVDTAS